MRRATLCRTTSWSAAPRRATGSFTSTTSQASEWRSTGTTPSATRPDLRRVAATRGQYTIALAEGSDAGGARETRERRTGMHCGVMVTGYNQGDWERLLA